MAYISYHLETRLMKTPLEKQKLLKKVVPQLASRCRCAAKEDEHSRAAVRLQGANGGTVTKLKFRIL